MALWNFRLRFEPSGPLPLKIEEFFLKWKMLQFAPSNDNSNKCEYKLHSIVDWNETVQIGIFLLTKMVLWTFGTILKIEQNKIK